MVAEDGGEAAVSFVVWGTGEEVAEFGARMDFQEGAEVDVAEDVVSTRILPKGDFLQRMAWTTSSVT